MRSQAKRVNTHPLRKVLYRDLHATPGMTIKTTFDFLECGHVRPAAQDIIGTRWPERRRCHKCTLGRDPDFKIEEESK